MSVDCEIVLEYETERDAIAVMEAISPDNAPYAEAERDGMKVIIRSRSDTCPQMLHTMEDLLACVRVAEETVQASK
ncbi:MAG: KEOPS complex subunit Pcc1 [Methanomassiliicoccus sp.]|nr:KEOPS complex subunit Pcc1 [Methanomassiliicoccus sp.]